MTKVIHTAAAIFIIAVSGFGVRGQDASTPGTTPADNQSGDKDNKPLIDKKEFAALQPTWQGRFGRAFQYQYQIGEQPRTVLVGTGSTANFIPNPEHYLKQHLLTFQFSELFTTSSDKALLVNRAYQNLKASAKRGQPLLGPDVCGHDQHDIIRCIAKGTNAFNRVLSGVTLGITLSERPAVQQGVIVSEAFSNHYTVAGQVHFDPTSLFITATNYKDALNNLTDADIDVGTECFTRKVRSDKNRVGECRKRLFTAKITGNDSGSRRFWDAFLQLALPTFDFKRMTQFDFVKNGGILIPAPFPESALNNYTFTWDLRHLIAPTKERLAAEDAIGAYKPKTKGSRFCIAISGSQENYISVANDFKINACQQLAESIHATGYRLGCLSETSNDSEVSNPQSEASHTQPDKKKFAMSSSEKIVLVQETASAPKPDSCGWGS
jgi:hypothetical protein